MVANQATNAREHMTSDVGRSKNEKTVSELVFGLQVVIFTRSLQKKESLYICVDYIFIYTWNLFVFYFFTNDPSKTRSFPIKTGVIWVPGIYIYIRIKNWTPEIWTNGH